MKQNNTIKMVRYSFSQDSRDMISLFTTLIKIEISIKNAMDIRKGIININNHLSLVLYYQEHSIYNKKILFIMN